VLIFVHWRKGPKWWTKIAPILFYSLTWILFIALPLINIGIVIFFFTISSDVLTDQYCLYFGLVAASRIIEFFVLIRPAMNNMIKNYYDNRIVLESGDQNAI
jgi:hypothetical protein